MAPVTLAALVIVSLSARIASDGYVEVNAVVRNVGRLDASGSLLCKAFDRDNIIVGVTSSFVSLNPGEVMQTSAITKPVRSATHVACEMKK